MDLLPGNRSQQEDEETFRFNERKGKDKDRFVKTAAGIVGKRVTHKELIATDDNIPRRGELRSLK